MNFLHTMIRVKDIKKSLDFYQNIFEMTIAKERTSNDFSLIFLADKSGTPCLELTYDYKEKQTIDDNNVSFGHLAFQVESIDEFSNKLSIHNLTYFKKPYKISPNGSTIAFIKDPDGYEIELIEKAK